MQQSDDIKIALRIFNPNLSGLEGVDVICDTKQCGKVYICTLHRFSEPFTGQFVSLFSGEQFPIAQWKFRMFFSRTEHICHKLSSVPVDKIVQNMYTVRYNLRDELLTMRSV